MPRFEIPRGGPAFDVELDGLVVRTARTVKDAVRLREKAYATLDEARYHYGRALARARAQGGVLVGPSQRLRAASPEPAGSMLLVEEHFAAGDDRFDAEILRVTASGALMALAPRWLADRRPWARRALLAYIDDGCDRPEHRGLVKRLFKALEAAQDDEAMAHFLVAFDGLGQRLFLPRGTDAELRSDPQIPCRARDGGPPRFSRATRTYLARRAYRYFRRLGFQAGGAGLPRYGRALRTALGLYRDERLATPAQLLDAWGLLHALYHRAPELRAGTHAFALADDAALRTLAPAPHFPAAWRGVFDELCALLVTAPSRPVRTWLVAWLRREEAAALAALPAAQVVALVTSAHAEAQDLGASLLATAPGLETLPIQTWLELLAIERGDLAEIVCAVVAKHVAPARLSLAQCVALTCASAAPVARLGLAWTRGKALASADDLHAVAQLGQARVASVRADAAAWATAAITAHPAAVPEHLRDLCDAPHADVRTPALVAATTTAALAPPALWFALTESPYDDVRAEVVRSAERWRAAASPATLTHVWASALLAVHGGSRTKAGVPRAIAERIAAHPEDAPALLPLLALALRSVRPPERVAGLTALARAIHGNPALRALAAVQIPELVVGAEVSA